MIVRLLLAFILIPLAELFVLLWLASKTSPLFTIGVVVVTGIAGTVLARYAGLQAWRRFRDATAAGRIPSLEIQHGLMIAFAAALLLTPGLLTDAFGLALLVEPLRERMRRFLARRMAGNFQIFHPPSRPGRGDGSDEHVIDAEGYRPVDRDHAESAAGIPPRR